MMARHRFFALAIHLGVIFTAIVTSGCTFVGFTIGSEIDASTPNTEIVTVESQMPFSVGDRVRVTRSYGAVIEGEYAGLARVDSIAEVSRHERDLRNEDGVGMPASDQFISDLVLLVKTRSGRLHVPLNEIRVLEKVNPKNAKWIGAGVGLLVDVIAVAVGGDKINLFGGGGGKW